MSASDDSSAICHLAENGTVQSLAQNNTVKTLAENGAVESATENGTVQHSAKRSTVESSVKNSTVESSGENSAVESSSENDAVQNENGNAEGLYSEASAPLKLVTDIKLADKICHQVGACRQTSIAAASVTSTPTTPMTPPIFGVGEEPKSEQEIMGQLKQNLTHLLYNDDLTDTVTYENLKVIKMSTSSVEDAEVRLRIADATYNLGIVDVLKHLYDKTKGDHFLSDRQPIALKNLMLLLGTIWNMSNMSVRLCQGIVDNNGLQTLLSILSHPSMDVSELTHSKAKVYIAKACIGSMHNIIRKTDSREMFRLLHAVVILQRYVQDVIVMVKLKALIVLSYIIDEQENEVLNAGDNNIEVMVKILNSCVYSDGHVSKKYGYDVVETISALNRLAINDMNKERLVQYGALTLYVELLKDLNQEEENLLAAKGLWILAFSEQNRRRIRQQDGCISALKNALQNSPSDSVKQASEGALWIIEGQNQPEQTRVKRLHTTARVPTDSSEIISQPHVMISYQWASKSIMTKVRNYLREAGYNVWMDVDHMSGSILEAMALAVERADIVLVCMSQKYKDSPSCRTEAEYTYRLQKPIIPLRLQTDYIPDGWLGIMVGTRLYFDFSCETRVRGNMPYLIKELGNRGKVVDRVDGPSTMAAVDGSQVLTNLPYPPIRSHLPAFPHTKAMSPHGSPNTEVMGASVIVDEWSVREVHTWLSKHGLMHLTQRLHGVNGDLLLEIKKMYTYAPEFFYNMVRTELELSFLDILKFTRALAQIK